MEREYVVTLENAEDADQFFAEMTAQSGADQIPARSVDVVNARPGSLRNTDYALTEAEAEALKTDPRVRDVEPLNIPGVFCRFGLTQSGDFYRGSSNLNASKLNWGLARCNATSNIFGLASELTTSYDYHLDGTGVDIVLLDSGIQAGHPEWEDAAGSSRLQQINWYTAAGVSGTMPANFYTDNVGHGTHVAGIAAGKTFGWARGAHIYSMNVDTGKIDQTTDNGATYTAYDLIRLWHNAKPVQSNGYKRPTIVNASLGWFNGDPGLPPSLTYRGTTYSGTSIDTSTERRALGWNADYNYNTYSSYVWPYRRTDIDTDCEDLINAGVTFVHAAGNDQYKMDLPNGPDYNNYAASASNLTRYNQGSSPTGAGNRANGYGDSIEVGSINSSSKSSSLDRKAFSSNAGPGVTIWAPGDGVRSAWTNANTSGGAYYLDNNYRQHTINGTSMAAPQVAGVAALIAQVNPQITPAEMKEYLATKFGQTGSIYTTGLNNDFSDYESLLGASDVMLYNPFNTPTAYKITNSGGGGGTAPTVSGSTSISIIENTSTSTVLATYTASGTTPITWSVTGTDASNFSINSSGQLTFAVSPDYETPADRSQSINVVATNSAGSDSHAVSITVTDDTSDNSGGGITSFDMGYTAAGQNKTAPNNYRTWCLERDASYGYTRYAWFKTVNANSATQYYWSGSAWTSQNVTRTFTALGNGWLGLADNGTLLCGVDSTGNISIVNKLTGSQVASASHSDNLQGVLWDGTYFWAGSFTTPSRAVRITTGGSVTNYTLPSSSPTSKANNRSAFYDFNKNYYYFGDVNAAHAYTFNGSSFTFVGQETSTEWTSQEGEYFEQSDGSKYLIAHNGTNLTSLTPV